MQAKANQVLTRHHDDGEDEEEDGDEEDQDGGSDQKKRKPSYHEYGQDEEIMTMTRRES